MAERINLERRRGDTFPIIFTLEDNTTSAPLDITGYAFRLAADPSQAPADSANNIFEVAGVVPTGTDGVVQFPLTASQADQQPGSYFYDVQWTDGGGAVRTIIAGRLRIVQDIAK
ncbi:MAG: hypothetical protein AAF360_13760 [Pseudomonadota bacterium]